MAFDIIRFDTDTALARSAAAEWILHLKEVAGNKTSPAFSYTVALSGGRITKTFFAELVSQINADPSDFKLSILPGIHFFWADERCVLPTDPENNYLMARDLLFLPLGILEKNIHRIEGELGDNEAVLKATADLNMFASHDNGLPVLDMIFLGMGEDGHVASLFPGEDEEIMKNPAIFRAVTAVKPPPRRITLGYSTIIAAKQVWILASGKGKETSFNDAVSSVKKNPLGRVIGNRLFSKVLTDIH